MKLACIPLLSLLLCPPGFAQTIDPPATAAPNMTTSANAPSLMKPATIARIMDRRIILARLRKERDEARQAREEQRQARRAELHMICAERLVGQTQ